MTSRGRQITVLDILLLVKAIVTRMGLVMVALGAVVLNLRRPVQGGTHCAMMVARMRLVTVEMTVAIKATRVRLVVIKVTRVSLVMVESTVAVKVSRVRLVTVMVTRVRLAKKASRIAVVVTQVGLTTVRIAVAIT